MRRRCAPSLAAPRRHPLPLLTAGAQLPGFIGLNAIVWLVGFLVAVPVPPAGAQTADGDVPVLREIVIEGNTHTSTSLIHREIGVAVGEPLSEDRIDPIWDQLEDLGYFAFVDISYEEQDDGGVVLRIMVEEDKTMHFGPVIEYDDRQKYLLGAWLTDRNFRGRGETIELRGIAYRIQHLGLGWTRPWLFGARGMDLDVTTAVEQGGFIWEATDYGRWDTMVKPVWHFSYPFFVDLSATYRVFDQKDSFSTAPVDRGDATSDDDLQFPAETRRGWLLGGGLGLDSRSNPYYPLRGFYARLAGIYNAGQNYDPFGVWSGDLRAFLSVFDEKVIALRAYGQSVTGPTPIEDRLYWGGGPSIRGYQRASAEGENGYLLTAEFRWPLFLMPISPQGELIGFGLHAFADWGDAWFDGAEAGKARRGLGLGAHINVTTFQFRFEAANNEDGDWVFHFMDRFNF